VAALQAAVSQVGQAAAADTVAAVAQRERALAAQAAALDRTTKQLRHCEVRAWVWAPPESTSSVCVLSRLPAALVDGCESDTCTSVGARPAPPVCIPVSTRPDSVVVKQPGRTAVVATPPVSVGVFRSVSLDVPCVVCTRTRNETVPRGRESDHPAAGLSGGSVDCICTQAQVQTLQAGGAEREQHAQRLQAAAEAAAAEAVAARAAALAHDADAAQLRPALHTAQGRAAELEAVVSRQHAQLCEMQNTLAAQRSDISEALSMVRGLPPRVQRVGEHADACA